MPELSAYHKDIYREPSITIRDRSRIVEKEIKRSLINEADRRSVVIGFSDYQFRWGRFNRSKDRELKLLELERQRQAVRIADVGVRLGLKEQDCFDTLPESFPERLDFYDRLGLDTPLLVPRFPRMSWGRVVDAMRKTPFWPEDVDLDYNLDPSKVKEWKDPRGVKIPDQPFATWVKIPPFVQYDIYTEDDPPRRIRNPQIDEIVESPTMARITLDPDARGATHWDGMALGSFRSGAKPGRFGAMELHDLIGSQIGKYEVLSLRQNILGTASAWLSATDIEDAPMQRTAIICSREVTVK